MTKKEIKVANLEDNSAAGKLLNAVETSKGNSQPKQVKRSVGRPSQQDTKDKHRTILIKSSDDETLKQLSTIYDTSVNEIINQAIEKYIKGQLKKSDVKEKLELLKKIQITR